MQRLLIVYTIYNFLKHYTHATHTQIIMWNQEIANKDERRRNTQMKKIIFSE